MEKLPVVFRKSEGEVVAVFPTLPFTYEGRLMTCYAHVGQHGGACFQWYSRTKRAKPEEYAELLTELKSIYETDLDGEGAFELVVYQRIQPSHRRAFWDEVNRLRRREPEFPA